MHIVSKILIGLVALIHAYILVLEMFLFESRGPKVFKTISPELFSHPDVQVLAANQGLYNGFLAAGLLWALLLIRNIEWKRNVASFFLLCVAIAGIYGTMSSGAKNIILVQTVPAALGLLSLWFLSAKKGPV